MREPTTTEIEIRELQRVMQRKRFKRKALNAVGAIALTAYVGGIGALVTTYVVSGRTIQDMSNKTFVWNYPDMQAHYQNKFAVKFQRLKDDIIDGYAHRLPLHDDDIDETAKKHELDPKLLRRIMNLNRYLAGVRDQYGSERVIDCNFLDPFATCGYDDNLEEGAKRLAGLVKDEKHVDYAVFRFYTEWEGADSFFSRIQYPKGEEFDDMCEFFERVIISGVHGLTTDHQTKSPELRDQRYRERLSFNVRKELAKYTRSKREVFIPSIGTYDKVNGDIN